jgi:hypothetical protein
MTQPENTIASVPQSVAEEDSVKAANDSIRDTLLQQSGRGQQQDQQQAGGGQQEIPQQEIQQQEAEAEEAGPRRSTRKTTDDE